MPLLWSQSAKPKNCPKCQSTNLNTRGIGIEQIEEETQKNFKEAQVERNGCRQYA